VALSCQHTEYYTEYTCTRKGDFTGMGVRSPWAEIAGSQRDVRHAELMTVCSTEALRRCGTSTPTPGGRTRRHTSTARPRNAAPARRLR